MAITLNVNLSTVVRIPGLRKIGKGLIMAVKNLTEAVDRLTAATDRLVNGGVPTNGVPQADVDVEAARVVEQAQRLEAIPVGGGGNGGTEAAPLRK